MENKINRFRGILEFSINSEPIVLRSLKVNDLFNLLLLSKNKTDEFTNGVNLLMDIYKKSYPEEPTEELEGFVVTNYKELFEELMICLGWTTRAKIIAQENISKEPESKEKNINLFKARLAAEADNQDIEDSYITTCYILMREFKYTRDEVLYMDASVFLILLDEMKKQNEKEEEEMKRNKTLKH